MLMLASLLAAMPMFLTVAKSQFQLTIPVVSATRNAFCSTTAALTFKPFPAFLVSWGCIHSSRSFTAYETIPPTYYFLKGQG